MQKHLILYIQYERNKSNQTSREMHDHQTGSCMVPHKRNRPGAGASAGDTMNTPQPAQSLTAPQLASLRDSLIGDKGTQALKAQGVIPASAGTLEAAAIKLEYVKQLDAQFKERMGWKI
jgi:Cu/Zn superoxide dismutase